jgi:2-keto-4-pentenoate hydratase/2-oxohepta-3-ene-1,7-dioic acid hydratase in catechol pathway
VKIARIASSAGSFTGVVRGELVRTVGPADDATVLSLALEAREHPSGWAPAGEDVPLASVQLLPPVAAAPSIRDFYAFERHVATARRSRGLEVDPGWYERPVFYFTNPDALVGHLDVVHAPAGCEELDFELEVAMVLARGGRDLRPADVPELVAGYTIMNDWSARDIQRAEMRLQLGPAKGKDFATSLGPWLVTPDEFSPESSAMKAIVNRREVSSGDLSELWWSFAEMACYASTSASLRPGDVIGSGTVGTGCLLERRATDGYADYPWLQPGDHVALTVDGLGALVNTIGPPAVEGWTPDPDRVRPLRV